MDQLDDLAGCLRSWRDRLDPAEVGLPAGRARRAPGLRREELAQLAGLSVDYLSRLEQGRASNPSASVLAPLARALRLTDAERDHLYRLAGHAIPGPGQINRHITPGLQRVLDRLTDVPVIVSAPSGEMVAANAFAEALVGELPADRDDSNLARKTFGLSPGSERFVRTPEELAALELSLVADLHEAQGRFPHDAYLLKVIADLRAGSPRFSELWDAHPVARRHADRKTIQHPQVGRITVDCDRLSVEGSDLTAIVYTATPGSPDADALALVATIGLQRFGAASPE